MFDEEPVWPLFDINVRPGTRALSSSFMFDIGTSLSCSATWI